MVAWRGAAVGGLMRQGLYCFVDASGGIQDRSASARVGITAASKVLPLTQSSLETRHCCRQIRPSGRKRLPLFPNV